MWLLATNPCVSRDNSCNLMWRLTGNEDATRIFDLVFGRPAVVIALVLAGMVVRWLSHRVIDRLVRGAERGVLPGRLSTLSIGQTSLADAFSALEGDYAQRRVARARTMGSLLKSLATGVIFTVVLLMSLSELNLDIAPLIASAGIAGIALGFGAQSLVKDFLAGLFLIFEDQYGVGDTVNLGEASGVVEAVSPRVTRLRDPNGTVWYVRNGEILRVGNQSQNWARVNVDVAVAYTEDLARVRRVLMDVAEEMWTDEDLDGLLVEPPEVIGVEQVVGDVVAIRVALKTPPMEQLGIARLFRERAKVRLDSEGIEVPTHLPWPAPPPPGPRV
jgi:small-conductance mechanosensitive channel